MNQKVRVIADGWLELESDPGLFTLLINDFGVKGVEIEEIYDLQKRLPGPVYGFIFLFKWLEGGRRGRRAKFELSSGVKVTDETVVNSVFFAHQKVQNSCATHAILSILMNCDDIELGSVLSEFKSFTKDMCPEDKGLSLNNLPELMFAHNKHASPDEWRDIDDESEIGSTIASTSTSSTATTATTATGSNASSVKGQEAFHFASYLPLNGHLYEMDSLKSFPIDHGPIPEGMEWQVYFQQLITEKIASANENNDSNEIRYNLMALVPCQADTLVDKVKFLSANLEQLLMALKALILAIEPDVFRRVFQISSFSQRKKLTDNELMEAAEYLLLVESDSVSSLPSAVNNNENEQLANLPADNENSNHISDTGTNSSNATIAPSGENIAELACASDLDAAKLLSTYAIEDFEICCQRKIFSQNTDGAATDFVELSSDQAGLSLFKNAPDVRRVVKLRLSPSQEKENFTLRDIVLCLKSLKEEIAITSRSIEEEKSKKQQFEIDDQHRTHDYDEFTRTFFSMMASNGLVNKNGAKNGKPRKSGKAANKRQKTETAAVKKQQQPNSSNRKRKLSK